MVGIFQKVFERNRIMSFTKYYMSKAFDYEKADKYYKFLDSGGKPFQVNGNEYAVYMFDLASIKEKIKRVEAVITVANDYKVQVAEIFTKQSTGGHDQKGQYQTWYNSTFWKTMAQADGNVKDGSNLRTFSVDFGSP